MRHVIRKQIIHLTVDKRLDAFEVQHLLSNYYQNEIIPMLEKLFNEVSTEEETILLETQEIDLGIFNLKQVGQPDWAAEIEKKIAMELKRSVLRSGNQHVTRIPETISISRQWLF